MSPRSKAIIDELWNLPHADTLLMDALKTSEFLLAVSETGSDVPMFGFTEAHGIFVAAWGDPTPPPRGHLIGQLFGRKFYAQPL